MSFNKKFSFWGCSDSGSSTASCDIEYSNDETEVIGYIKKGSGSCPTTDIEIPDEVTHIAENAFKDKGLTSVTFPESIEEIAANQWPNKTFIF